MIYSEIIKAFMDALYNPFTELMNHPHKSLVEHLPHPANSYSTTIKNLLLLNVKVHHYISIPLDHNTFNPERAHNIQAQYFVPSFFTLRSQIICLYQNLKQCFVCTDLPCLPLFNISNPI